MSMVTEQFLRIRHLDDESIAILMACHIAGVPTGVEHAIGGSAHTLTVYYDLRRAAWSWSGWTQKTSGRLKSILDEYRAATSANCRMELRKIRLRLRPVAEECLKSISI